MFALTLNPRFFAWIILPALLVQTLVLAGRKALVRTSGRRSIRFAQLSDVINDVERLRSSHRTLGQWSLAQICNHLSATMRYTVEGFPGPRAPWLVRHTFGATAKRFMLWTGRIPEGVRAPNGYVPAPKLELDKEVEGLKEAVARFQRADGQLKEHPLIGSMTRAQWEQYHCAHCAHHLSFVQSTS
jgi:hypothetical protein